MQLRDVCSGKQTLGHLDIRAPEEKGAQTKPDKMARFCGMVSPDS